MILNLLGQTNNNVYLMILVVATFFISFVSLNFFKRILPKDQGRQFAVNGALSEGKPRGAGIIIITAFTLCTALFVPLKLELVLYLLFVYAAMLTGFFDDAAEKPWGELKKGVFDFIIAIGTVATYIYYNDTQISIFGHNYNVPVAVFGILGVVLIWVSINVTNCSDGVDGLCGSLFGVSLVSFMIILFKNLLTTSSSINFILICLVMLMSVLAYLWFNCSPSKLLMGDAGSRAFGVFLAICALKTDKPLLYIPICLVLIIDGGLGLIKLSFRRFLGMKKFMDNIRTPIHDHMRKNKNWSDTQVVIRFVIIQIVICLAVLVF